MRRIRPAGFGPARILRSRPGGRGCDVEIVEFPLIVVVVALGVSAFCALLAYCWKGAKP